MERNDQIFILNKYDKIIGLLSNSLPKACQYNEDLHHEILENAYEIFSFKVPIKHSTGMPDLLEEENKVAFYDLDGILKVFKIKQVKDLSVARDKFIFAEFDSIELINKVIRPKTFAGSPKSVLTSILSPTRWEVGIVDSATTDSLILNEYQSALYCIHEVAKLFDLEIRFRIEFKGNRISNRYVDLLQQVGENNGVRIEYRQDIRGFTRTKDTTELATSLIGVGKANENSVITTFKDVSWAKSLGHPTDKPLGQDWVGDNDALSNFGIDGQHIERVFLDSEEMDPMSLLYKTWDDLQKRIKSSVTYEIDILLLERLPEYEHKKVRKGDTIYIKDTSFAVPLVIEARILEMKRSKSNPSDDSVVLGEFREIEIKESEIIRKLQLELSKKSAKWDNNLNVTESDTEPENITSGMYWLDTSRIPNIWRRRTNDNTAWEAATPSNASEVGAEATIHVGSTPPPDTIRKWMDTSQAPNILKRFDGSTWVSAGGEQGPKGDTGDTGQPGVAGPRGAPGQYNLCENPDFEGDTVGTIPSYWTAGNVADISIFSSGNGSNKAMSIDARNGQNNDVYSSNIFPVIPGQKFYVEAEGRYLSTAGTGNGGIGFRRWDARKQVLNTWDSVISFINKPTAFTKLSGEYTVPVGCYYLQIWATFSNNAETTNKLYIDNIRINQMVDAELIVPTAISSDRIFTNILESLAGNFVELNAGVMTGVDVTLGGIDNGNGRLVVLNDAGEVIADLNAADGGFDNLYVGTLNSPSVVNRDDTDVTFYVNPSTGDDENDGSSATPFSSLSRAISMIPHYITGSYIIELQANITDDIHIYGTMGPGDITLNLNNFTITGSIDLSAIMCRVNLVTGIINNSTEATYATCTIARCMYVFINNCTFYSRGIASNSVAVIDHAYAYLYACKFYNSTADAVRVSYMGHCVVVDCTGKSNGQYGMWAQSGGLIAGNGTAPTGPTGNTRTSQGGTIPLLSAFTFPVVTPPASPAAPDKVFTWTSSDGESYRSSGYIGWQDKNDVRQGQWSGGGQNQGYWFFTTGVNSTLNGKTIKKIRFYASRKSSGGNSGAVSITFKTHTYASQPAGAPIAMGSATYTVGFRWGESKWITLPSSFYAAFQSGGAMGIGIYTSNTSSSYYAIFDDTAKLEVTYA